MATFSTGCYWGSEEYFCTEFAEKHPCSILSVGFMSPNQKAVKNLDYYGVCTGTTGHFEVVHLQYDDTKCSFQDMAEFFYTFHDPTILDKQGNDRGTQYASVILYHDLLQKEVAQAVTAHLQKTVEKNYKSMNFKIYGISTLITEARE